MFFVESQYIRFYTEISECVWSSSSTDCSSSEKDLKGFIGSFKFESLLSLSSFECGLYSCMKGKMIGLVG